VLLLYFSPKCVLLLYFSPKCVLLLYFSPYIPGECVLVLYFSPKCVLLLYFSPKCVLLLYFSPKCVLFLYFSPYIPSECVLVDDDGQCYLWSTGRLDTICAQGEPRFHVNDSWRHVQYGSHPRHVVYADQTAVQMFDLRVC
jgi:hypothetical protein